MELEYLLLLLYLWIGRTGVGLLLLAAIITAIRTRTLHSILLTVATLLLISGQFLHYLATPQITMADFQSGAAVLHFSQPLETISKVVNVGGVLCAALGASCLIVANFQRKRA